MSKKKHSTSAALIGDVLGSRASLDRDELHARLAAALAAVNERLRPRTPLRIIVGDDYQGAFASVGDALAATLLLRLELLPDADVRHGVAWGEVRVLGESPRVEDGSAWWAARDSIEEIETKETKASLRGVRTGYALAEGTPGPDPGAINAALMQRDHMVSGLSPRSVSVLRGLLWGSTQQEIADREGISASAVSQRVRADGLGVLVVGYELLQQVV